MIKSIISTSMVALALAGAACAASGNSASVLVRGVELKNRSAIELKSDGAIKPSGKYLYTITGEVLGFGAASALTPAPVSLGRFFENISPGFSKYLTGAPVNTGGTLPFTVMTKTFSGMKKITGYGDVSVALTMTTTIEANGIISFTINNVKLRNQSGALGGGLMIRSGKVLVQVAPTFETPTANIGITEDKGSIKLQIRRFGSLDLSASIGYATVADGAVANVDYTPISGRLKFAPGQSVATVSIPIIDNNTDEATRAFKLVISKPSANAQLGAKTTSTVNIQDND